MRGPRTVDGEESGEIWVPTIIEVEGWHRQGLHERVRDDQGIWDRCQDITSKLKTVGHNFQVVYLSSLYGVKTKT